MRSQRRTREEQYQLILQCRNSGQSDYIWCKENGIKPSTFYNWIRRLRETGVYDIPCPAGRDTYAPTPEQDIVKVELVDEEPVVQIHRSDPDISSGIFPHQSFEPSLELVINNASLRVSNKVDPELLAKAIFMVRKQ